MSPSFWHIVRCRWNILPELTVWGGDNWGGREIKVKATSHDWYGSSPELLGSPLCGFDTSPFWHRLQACWNNEPFADGTGAAVTRDYCPEALRLARDWCGQSVLIRFVRWKLNTYFWDRQMAERKREECVCLFVCFFMYLLFVVLVLWYYRVIPWPRTRQASPFLLPYVCSQGYIFASRKWRKKQSDSREFHKCFNQGLWSSLN